MPYFFSTTTENNASESNQAFEEIIEQFNFFAIEAGIPLDVHVDSREQLAVWFVAPPHNSPLSIQICFRQNYERLVRLPPMSAATRLIPSLAEMTCAISSVGLATEYITGSLIVNHVPLKQSGLLYEVEFAGNKVVGSKFNSEHVLRPSYDSLLQETTLENAIQIAFQLYGMPTMKKEFPKND